MTKKIFLLETKIMNNTEAGLYPLVAYPDDLLYNTKKANSMTEITIEKVLDFKPDIHFKLAKRAKFMDVMRKTLISACGFIVSEKFANIIKQFRISPHHFYDAKIENAPTPYYFFSLLREKTYIQKHIDFKNSIFKKMNFEDENIDLYINSFEEYEQKIRQVKEITDFISFKKAAFLSDDYDIFIHPNGVNVMINEAVANAIKDCTGFKLTEYPNVVVP